jgi:GxxExxY protein
MNAIDGITEIVIGCAYEVSNTLGAGFLEKVYENALVYEIKYKGLNVDQQYNMKVKYKDIIAGEYIADLLIEKSVLVELKSVKALDNVHLAQCLNYLKALDLKICLLINFGNPKVEIKRIMN